MYNAFLVLVYWKKLYSTVLPVETCKCTHSVTNEIVSNPKNKYNATRGHFLVQIFNNQEMFETNSVEVQLLFLWHDRNKVGNLHVEFEKRKKGSGFSSNINKRAELLVFIFLVIVIRMEIVMGKGWIC